MRPLIQYDLDEHPAAPSEPPAPPQSRPPPAKKRKRNHRPRQRSLPRPKPHVQHWDDPGSSAVGMVYDEQEGGAEHREPVGSESMSYAEDEDDEDDEGEGGEVDGIEEEEEVDEESRELTHEEIWDDSALIDAWHSAEAEYEAYHGTSKAWKSQPVQKSPLWYNKPYTGPTTQAPPRNPKPPPSRHGVPPLPDDEPDTAPLDFYTFVPTHDPSLSVPSDTSSKPSAPSPFFIPPPSATMLSRDEAFNNAVSAMYWSGYWTAVYHCQSRSSGRNSSAPAEATAEDEIEADEEEDLVPAQR